MRSFTFAKVAVAILIGSIGSLVLARGVTTTGDGESAVVSVVLENELELFGVVHLPDGEPAEGARLQLNAWSSDSKSEAAGIPDFTGEPFVLCDRDGKFSLRFTREAKGHYSLRLTSTGYTQHWWFLDRLDLTAPVDLGTTTLAAAGSVRVRITNGRGEATTGLWGVTGHARGSRPGQGGVASLAGTELATGIALLEGLPAGQVEVSARTSSPFRPKDLFVEVIENEVVDVHIIFEGPDPSRSITLDIETWPFPFLHEREVTAVQLIGTQGEQLIADVDASSGLWTFADLPADTYTLRIDDPRFEPWLRADLKRGTRVVAELVLSSGVLLDVVDDATGEPIEKFQLFARLNNSRARPNERLLKDLNEPPTSDGFYGLLPEDTTLLVSAEGYGLVELPIGEIGPGEKRAVQARMNRAETVHGRVVMNDGVTSVGGAFIYLRKPGTGVAFDSGGAVTGTLIQEASAPLASGRAADDGSFKLIAAPGEYSLQVIQGNWHTAVIDPFVIPKGGLKETVMMQLPPAATIEGKITGGDFADLVGARVQPWPDAKGLSHMLHMADRSAPVQADGSFRIEFLPAGAVQLQLCAGQEPEDGFDLPFRWPGTYSISLGSVELSIDGPNQHEFQIAEKWPAQVSLRLKVNGEQSTTHRLLLFAAGESHSPAVAESDAEGDCTMRCLPPGEYFGYVSSKRERGSGDSYWEAELPHKIYLEPGEMHRIEHELSLTTGRVQLVDQVNKEPLAHREVRMRYVGDTTDLGSTDKDGWLELTLPAGSFKFELKPLYDEIDHTDCTVLDWLLSGTLHWTDNGPAKERVSASKRTR